MHLFTTYIVWDSTKVIVFMLIVELAKGAYMSEFRWNSGGSFHNKDWEEDLPTDSAVSTLLWLTHN
jgi:hypothetical protein